MGITTKWAVLFFIIAAAESSTLENTTNWSPVYDERAFSGFRRGTDYFLQLNNSLYESPNATRLSREGAYGYNYAPNAGHNPPPPPPSSGHGHETYRGSAHAYGPNQHGGYHDLSPYNYDHYYDDYEYYDECGGISGLLKVGAAKLGVLGIIKAIIAAVGAGLLTKIPVLIVKLLFKLIVVPIGFLIVLIPVLLILLLPLLIPLLLLIPVPVINIGNRRGTTAKADGSSDSKGIEIARISKLLLESDQCLERIACEIGRYNSVQYFSTINWLLDIIQRFVPKSSQERMKSYREAYGIGARKTTKEKLCSGTYQCNFSALFTTSSKTKAR